MIALIFLLTAIDTLRITHKSSIGRYLGVHNIIFWKDPINTSDLMFRAKKFKKLKALRIEKFDELDLMIIEDGVMPELKRLTLSKCRNLKLFLFGIGSLMLLEEFLLYEMPDEFIISKLQIDSDEHN